jgi:Pyruvate/2-oxoacid:ferredoxin oxidoreductase gamma subunit
MLSNVSWLSLLLIINMQSFSSAGTDAPVIGMLNQIDVAVKEIKNKCNSDISKATEFKNWCDSLLKKQPHIHTVLIADNKGKVLFECSRHIEKSSIGTNVSKNDWFSNTVSNKSTEYYEVVKNGDKRVLLNSWVSGQKMVPDAESVIVVLIDLEMVLTSVNDLLPAPAALLYNGKVLYESNWVMDASRMISTTEMKGLEIAVMNTNDQILPNATLVPSISLADENSLFLGIAIVALLVGITGIILFTISQNTALKLRKDSYLKLEEEKLSDQEKEKIHKLAVSHVYCEVKRQVETHELHDIESQVRREIETSIRNKPIILDPEKIKMAEKVMNN